MSKTNREQFEAWGMSDTDLRITLECETYAGIAWLAWQAATNEAEAQLTAITTQLESVVAENADLNSNLMYWSSEDAEPARSPLDIAHEASFGEGVEFDVQVAARMPSMTYRVVRRTTYSTEIELVWGGVPETPATNAFLAEVRASGVDDFCNLLGSYAKVEPERFNPQFADLYAKIANRIFSEVMDNPEVYDLGTMSDWLEREAENSRAYADMSLVHHSQLRQEAK